ncbi:MAG: hypothetical protein H8Z69_02880 [Nanohaloarchaea archaeon]|nr:hypothetical protein [Candidatus Nanohaloarchaea archaeon]
MQKEKAVLSLLFLSVVASGCMSSGNSTGSVTVKSLNVEPTQIFEGQSVRAQMEIENTGNIAGEVAIGEDGKEILRGHCPDIFSVDSSGFSVTSTRDSYDGESAKLEPGDQLRVRWKLNQKAERVPLYGLDCDLKFPVKFNYSVSGLRQVQIKKNKEVEGSNKLQTQSSPGPMNIVMGTLPSSTGKTSTFIADTSDDSRDLSIAIQLRNPNPESEEYRKGVVDVNENSFRIEATEPLELDESMSLDGEDMVWNANGYSDPKCEVPQTRRGLRLDQGKSVTIRCNIPLPEKNELQSPSAISEISAHVNYTYEKDAGTRNIKVESRGQ